MSKTREFIYLAIGTSFGLGLSPIAPGSFGALVGVAYHVGVVLWLPASWHVPMLVAGLALGYRGESLADALGGRVLEGRGPG